MLLMLAVIAQAAGTSGFSETARWVLICLGIVAVVFIVAQAIGVAIPSWVWKLALVVLAVFLGILAIRFLAAM